MELVINIPKEIKEKRDAGKVLSSDEIATVCIAIKHSTPLPKGHGRLIILSEDVVKREQIPLGSSCQSWIGDVGLSNATVAIIEADKWDYENDEYFKGAQEEC